MYTFCAKSNNCNVLKQILSTECKHLFYCLLLENYKFVVRLDKPQIWIAGSQKLQSSLKIISDYIYIYILGRIL